MKKVITVLFVCMFAFSMLAACNNDAKSPSGSKVVSSISGVAPEQALDLQAVYDAVAPAVGMGEGALKQTMTDLTASGMVKAEDLVGMVGAQSKEYIGNGGMLLVLQAKEGSIDAVKASMEAYRDGQVDFMAQYEEFENAVNNIREARIVISGNVVVYASCGTGHEGGYAALDEAIAAALA